MGDGAHANADGADLKVTIKPKPLTADMLSGKGTSLIFSGQPQGPTVAVKDGTTTLEEGTAVEPKDYVLTNTEATTAGSYAVTVTGTGNYTGSVQMPFSIAPYEIGDNDTVVIGGVNNFIYTGQDQRPTGVTVTLNGTALREGPDFEITYPESSVNADNYEITVTFKNNYTGTTTKGYKIVPKMLTDPSITIADAPSEFVFSGAPQGPAITLKDGTTTLTKGTDYKVTGGEATGVGNGYKAVITGTGNYMGKIEKPFSITPYMLGEDDKLEIIFDNGNGSDEFTYNGQGQRPDASNVSVKITKADGTQVTLGASVLNVKYLKADGTEITTTTGSTDAGTYQVQVTLTVASGYNGSAARGYVINPKPITAADVEFNGPAGFEYTYGTQATGDGMPQGPIATVKADLVNDAGVTTQTLLNQGQDYTVADAPKTDAGSYTMVVKGTGNFCGEVTQPYTIKKAQTQESDLSNANKPTVNKTDGKDGLVYNGGEQSLVTGPTTMPQGYVEVLYSTDGGATWTTEPKGTDAGDYTVQVKYVGDKNHKDLTISPLAVKIVQRQVTFTGESAPRVYNGSEQEITNISVSSGANEGLVSGHTHNVIYSAKGTAKGEYPGTFSYGSDNAVIIKDASGADVTNNYAITMASPAGTLTITKAKVDGDGNLVDDSGNHLDQGGQTTTDPNQYVKVVDVRGKDGDDAPVYDGTPKVPVVFDEQSKDEDGNPKKLEEGTDHTVKYYDANDIDENGQPKTNAQEVDPADAGQKVAVVTLTGDYDGTVNVPMNVQRRPAVFNGDTKSFSYDGKKHTVETLTVKDMELVEGHTYNVRYLAEGTTKGDYAGAFVKYNDRDAPTVIFDEHTATVDTSSNFIFDAQGTDVTANYTISFVLGNLRIGATKIQDYGNGEGVEVNDNGEPIVGTDGKPAVRVNVTVGYDNENPPVYDGKDHAPTVHDVQGNKDLTEGLDYAVRYYEPQRDNDGKVVTDDKGRPVADTSKPLTAADAGSADAGDKVAVVEFTGDYTGQVTIGTNVLKRPVTFTGNSAEKTYTGAKQSATGYEASTDANEGLLTGEEFGHTTTPATADAIDTVSAKAEGVKVGDYTGTITDAADVKIYDKTGKDQTSNYQVSTEPGTLTIKPAKIADGGNSKGYVTDDFGNPVDDEGNPSKTEDGKPVRDADGNPVDQNDKSIKPAIDITSKGGDNTPTYDGTPKDPVVVDNKATDQNGDPQPKTLEKGTDYDVEYFEPKRDDEGNYVDDEGNPTNAPVPDRNKPTDPADAGEKVAVITLKGDYEGTISKPVTIAPAALAIRTGSATKPYDGTPLTNNEVTIDGLAKGETVEVEVTGSQTEIGSSRNTFTTRFAGESEAVVAESAKAAPKNNALTAPSLLLVGQSEETPLFKGLDAAPRASVIVAEAAEPTAKRSNYDLAPASETEGTLTVTTEDVTGNVSKPDGGKRIEVTPVPTEGRKPNGNDTSTYTGKPVDSPAIYDTNKKDENGNPVKLKEGTDYDVTYYEANPDGTPNLSKPISGKPTDAGTYAMVVTFKGAYTGSHTMPVTINKAKLVVTTPSAKKTYDGKALTTDKKDASIKGFVNNETAPFSVTGTQTQVGSSKNTYTIDWKSSEATAKQANYEVSENLGTLTVSAAAAKQNNSTSTGSGTRSGGSASGGTTTRQATAKTGDASMSVMPFLVGAATAIIAGIRRRKK